MNESDVRQMVIERMTEKGWIKQSWVKEVAPNQTMSRIEWSELGIPKMRALCALFDELGYFGVHTGGEFEILWQLMRQFNGTNGLPNTGSAADSQRY